MGDPFEPRPSLQRSFRIGGSRLQVAWGPVLHPTVKSVDAVVTYSVSARRMVSAAADSPFGRDFARLPCQGRGMKTCARADGLRALQYA
jgi:hypothetical protein